MRRRRYSGYQGRPGARDVMKIVLSVLILVLVLAVAGLMVGQRYIVYTDDGIRLELPFFSREQGSDPGSSAPVEVVQLPGKPKPQQETENVQQPDEELQQEQQHSSG